MTAWVDVAGWTLLHFVWQGTSLALLALAGLWLLRHARPQARYLLACLALAAMAAMPIATAFTLSADVPHRVLGPPAAAAVSDDVSAGTPGASRTTSEAPRAGHAILPSLVALWAAGVLLLLARLAHGWYRLRQLHAIARLGPPSRWTETAAAIAARIGLRRAIRVVDTLAVTTPVVVGWLQPIVLMPVAALANLTPAQVAAILAHELTHIRRHDFAINLLQALVETLLFYHPAVWWLSQRIRTEREHCCDAVAVSITGDTITYVEALTQIEVWRAGTTPLAVAATGGSLLDRVRRVLAADGTTPSRGLPIVAAAGCAFMMTVGGAAYVAAVEPAEPPPAEAVAWPMVFDHPSGQLTIKGFTGRDLIRFAYDLPASRVVGGPAWLDTESIDLSAHLDEDPGASGIQAVVRNILETRMGLTTTTETRDFPAYALVNVTGGGPGITPAAPCVDVQAWLEADPARRPFDLNGTRRCGTWSDPYSGLHGDAVTMADLADTLEHVFQQGLDHLDVFDRTGLAGRYDIRMELSPLLATAGRFRIPGVRLPGMSRLPGELTEQIGVTIEPITHPYDVIVVEGIHRPRE